MRYVIDYICYSWIYIDTQNERITTAPGFRLSELRDITPYPQFRANVTLLYLIYGCHIMHPYFFYLCIVKSS